MKGLPQFSDLTALLTPERIMEMAVSGSIFAAGLVAVWAFNRWGVQACVKKFAAKNPNLSRPIGRAIAAPVSTVLFMAFFNTAKSAFKSMPGWLWQMLENATKIIYFAAILVLLFRLVDIVVAILKKKWETPDSGLDEQMVGLVDRGLKAVVLVIVAVIALDQMGVKVLGLLAGLGFLGAAAALALQSTVANIIGSVEILADRLFRVGDRVAFGEYDGFVSKMGLRSVQLTSLYGDSINLPNKDFVDKQIRNFSRGRFVRTTVTAGITYDNRRDSIERAMALMSETVAVLQKTPGLPEVRSHEVVFRRMADYHLELDLIFWASYKDDKGYNRIMTAANLEIKEAFDKAGIEFAFPTQTLHLRRA